MNNIEMNNIEMNNIEMAAAIRNIIAAAISFIDDDYYY